MVGTWLWCCRWGTRQACAQNQKGSRKNKSRRCQNYDGFFSCVSSLFLLYLSKLLEPPNLLFAPLVSAQAPGRAATGVLHAFPRESCVRYAHTHLTQTWTHTFLFLFYSHFLGERFFGSFAFPYFHERLSFVVMLQVRHRRACREDGLRTLRGDSWDQVWWWWCCGGIWRWWLHANFANKTAF